MKILIEHTFNTEENRIAKNLDDAAVIIGVPRPTVMRRLANSNGKVVIGQYLLTIL